jgi:nucleotide-binding universal stress UspA family protein
MATTAHITTEAPARTHIFDRVLVGVDSSDASIEAARQAAVLAEHYGRLKVLGVYPPPTSMGGDFPLDLRGGADDAVAKALAAINPAATTSGNVARGFTWSTLISEADEDGSTLIVVGSHGQGRLEGIVSASTMTELVHKSPCSVLVARHVLDRFPLRVVVGLDGSPESARAYAAARRIVNRFGSAFGPVVATGGKHVDVEAVSRLTNGNHDELHCDPVEALVAAASDADLLVVGSRGLHGVKALGSVSERVAHRAPCSTLIVRERADVLQGAWGCASGDWGCASGDR